MSSTQSSHRLLSLDIARGLTVAAMITVNNGHGDAFGMLRHAKWDGLTPCDLVFPFFLFIMGVSIFLSYSRRGFTPSRSNIAKIVRRTVVLFAIGICINWLDRFLSTDFVTSFEELRFWGVMQRIAICYLLASLFALTAPKRATIPTAAALLVCYAAILLTGNGLINDREQNILWIVDEHLLGYNHLYHYQAVDPEGLIGTLGALANVLFGFHCAWAMSRARNIEGKLTAAYTLGAILVFVGFALHFGLPFNKRVWTPSFTCATSGLCALMIGLTMKRVDAEGHNHGAIVTFFRVFGTNALILYVASEVIAILLGSVGADKAIFSAISAVITYEPIASLIYALLFMLLNWAIGYVLWRRRIFIKL